MAEVGAVQAADQPEPTAFFPIQRRRAFEQILAQLQAQILNGDLRPGDRLPNERRLAELLGVGRPSVREALRVLEALEIIDVRPGAGASSGSVITDRMGSVLSGLLQMQLALGHFSPQDLVATRLVLETSTVRSAAENRSEDQLARIEAILLELENNEQDRAAYLSIDAQYHLAIAEAAGNELLAHLMHALRASTVHHMTTQTSAWEDWNAVIAWASADHRDLYRAIAARDPDAAENALRHHLSFYAQPPPGADRK